MVLLLIPFILSERVLLSSDPTLDICVSTYFSCTYNHSQLISSSHKVTHQTMAHRLSPSPAARHRSSQPSSPPFLQLNSSIADGFSRIYLDGHFQPRTPLQFSQHSHSPNFPAPSCPHHDCPHEAILLRLTDLISSNYRSRDSDGSASPRASSNRYEMNASMARDRVGDVTPDARSLVYVYHIDVNTHTLPTSSQ